MNKEELINKFFEKLLQYADGAEKFAQDQAPKYIEELLRYGAVEALWDLSVWSLITLVIMLYTIYYTTKLKSYMLKNPLAEGFLIFSWFSLLFFSGLSFSCGVKNNYLKIKQIELAPRVYIVEELRK